MLAARNVKAMASSESWMRLSTPVSLRERVGTEIVLPKIGSYSFYLDTSHRLTPGRNGKTVGQVPIANSSPRRPGSS